MPQLISLAEAASLMGVNPRTIRRMIEAGDLTGYRIGTRVLRVDAAEVAGLPQLVAKGTA